MRAPTASCPLSAAPGDICHHERTTALTTQRAGRETLMHQRKWSWGWPLRLLAPAVGVTVVLAGTHTAYAEPRPRPVTGWIRQNAAPLNTVDHSAPLDDLAPLGRSIGDAEIVGLGESTHGAAVEPPLRAAVTRPAWSFRTARRRCAGRTKCCSWTPGASSLAAPWPSCSRARPGRRGCGGTNRGRHRARSEL
jgi:hypothetical protein